MQFPLVSVEFGGFDGEFVTGTSLPSGVFAVDEGVGRGWLSGPAQGGTRDQACA